MTTMDLSERLGISHSTVNQASLCGEKIARKLTADLSGSRSLSKTWYKDLIYEIERLAEEEKKNAEKYLYENNKEMMMQAYNVYIKPTEKITALRRDLRKK
ncbi:MAG: hypothetical protein U9N83_16385 [Thermodesulfobacteriota bacterium]|nr:hypothetical protein [Thermodesulfobacteriota bacterium]